MGEREISHCRDLHPTSHVQLVRLHDKVVLTRALHLSEPDLLGSNYRSALRRSCALMATMIVLSDISTAPIAAGGTMPHGASTPAAEATPSAFVRTISNNKAA